MSQTVRLSHGGGGRDSRDLVEKEIVPRFGNKSLPDAAALRSSSVDLLFSTDSFVVQPIAFPGGNIGDLAVYGTVNDLAVCGARPRWLSLGLILEEGLPFELLRTVLDSIKAAAENCGVAVVTGDTKVVGRGSCDKMYINTAGIGEALPGFCLSPSKMQPGDVVVVSGTLAAHGMAVLAARESFALSNGPESDTGPVHRLVEALSEHAGSIRVMRDPTRGGLAAVLNEFVACGKVGIEIEESRLPFDDNVIALAEMLGIDPLHAPSEGRIVAVCSSHSAEDVLETWRRLPEGNSAAIIGKVIDSTPKVILSTVAGGRRVVDMPKGELLPRIC